MAVAPSRLNASVAFRNIYVRRIDPAEADAPPLAPWKPLVVVGKPLPPPVPLKLTPDVALPARGNRWAMRRW